MSSDLHQYCIDHKLIKNDSFKSHETHLQHNIFDPMYIDYKKELNRMHENEYQYKNGQRLETPRTYNGENQYQKHLRNILDSIKQNKIVSSIFQKTSKSSAPEMRHDFLKQIEENGSLPYIQAEVIRKMREMASFKAAHGQYRESYVILENILNLETASLGPDHPQVARTLYQIGLVLDLLGDSDRALLAIQDGINILFPRRFSDGNMDLAAMYYQLAIMKGKKGEYQSALYHLDLAAQVETYIIGHCTELTSMKIAEYKYAHRISQQLKQVRPRTA